MVNYSNTPAEMIEADQPIAVEHYGLVPDTGGPGRYRGGLAIERHLRFKVDDAVPQIRSDRRGHRTYGLAGGGQGASSDVTIRRAGGEEERFPAKFLTRVNTDDVFRVRLAGGGGHGNPLDRDPAAVLVDVLEEKISPGHARDAYGVVIAGEPPQVDMVATRCVRVAMGAQTS